MRRTDRSAAFRRDYKRETKGQHRAILEADFLAVVGALIHDLPLEPKHRDHALTCNWHGYRECHIKPDLLLIYRKTGEALYLARLGSHGELFR